MVSRRARSRWMAWGLLWGVVAWGLIAWYPLSPSVSIPGMESTRFQEFVDDHVAMFWQDSKSSDPGEGLSIVLVDVSTGEIKERHFAGKPIPSPIAGEASLPEPEPEPEPELTDDESSYRVPFSPPKPYTRRETSGDFLLERRHNGVDWSRFTVWNWRTGEQLFDREFGCVSAGLIGDRIWVRPFDPEKDDKTSLFDIRTGAPVPTSLPARVSMGFPSPDNRIVLKPHTDFVETAGGFREKHEIEVWNVVPGARLFVVEADLFEFFPDSRRLATLTHSHESRRRRPSARTWRIYDLDGGAVLAERREPVDPEGDVATELVVQEGDRIAAYARSRWGDQQTVEFWSWKDNELSRIQATEPPNNLPRCGTPGMLGRSFGVPRNRSEQPDRFLVDGEDVIDVVTRKRCGSLPSNVLSPLLAPGWAVGRELPGKATAWLAARSNFVARRAFRAKLYDVSTGKVVGSLGKDPHPIFSPDGGALLTRDESGLHIWRLPASRPILAPLLWSLCCPLLVGLLAWRRARPPEPTELSGDERKSGAWEPSESRPLDWIETLVEPPLPTGADELAPATAAPEPELPWLSC